MGQILEFTGNHPMLVGGFIAVLVLLIWNEASRRVRGVAELSPAQAIGWINDPNALVVDISATSDFHKGHIVNARNLQASRLADPDAEILKLKERKLLVVCKSGQGALAAANSLRKLGATQVAVLKGGMTSWRSEQFPVTTK